MTTPTPDQINARIAEVLGWKKKERESNWFKGLTVIYWQPPNSDAWIGQPPPNYCGSLDAAALFEATLTDCQHHLWRTELKRIVCEDAKVGRFSDAARKLYISATAIQRALAFLAVHDKL